MYALQKKESRFVNSRVLMFFNYDGLHCDDNEVLVFRWLLHMWSLATLAHPSQSYTPSQGS